LDFGLVSTPESKIADFQRRAVSPRLVTRDRLVWLFLAVALLVRIFYNLALHGDGHPPASFVIDEREYFGAAHVLAEGRGFSFFDTALWVRPPLYVLLLAPPVGIFGANTVPVLIVQSVLSAATLLPLAWLAWLLGGLRAARMAAGLGAVYLPFTLFAGLLLSETLFTLLFSLLLVALVLARRALIEQRFSAGLWWAGAAGALLGLCALTRSTALGFVPLAAAWLLFAPHQGSHDPSPITDRPSSVVHRPLARLLPAGVLLAVCAIVLLPWLVRNYRAYGKLVPVDTTGAYNLWLGSVGVRDEARLQADLRAIANPADRQSFAYAQAWKNITADPGFFVRKGLKESLDLWRPLFSAEERQLAGYVPGRVPAWHLFALTVFDDLLYLGILLLSVVGLFLARANPLRSLTLLWVGLWVVMAFVFFAVTRFRLPVVAALLPWAGAGLGLLLPVRDVANKVRSLPGMARAGVVVMLAAVLLVVTPGIALPDVALGAERWAQQEPYREAEALLGKGQARAAIEAYKRANLEVADTRYGLAAALLQTGDAQGALAQLTSSEPPDRFEPAIIQGDAARRSGNLTAAKAFFNQRVVKLAGDAALEWAWDHLSPPAVVTIDIGSGLDIGYVRGFDIPEVDSAGVPFRWSAGDAQVRGLASKSAVTVRVTASGWRVPAQARATISIHATHVDQWTVLEPNRVALKNLPGWETLELPVAGVSQSAIAVSMNLNDNMFVAGGSDPRLLGIRVSRV
jgi:4-amino-4-deoxy-L-arabinose transferase-like glycosyltransferase